MCSVTVRELWKIRLISLVQGLVKSVQSLLLVDLKGRPRLGLILCIVLARSAREGAAFAEVS